MDKNSQEVGISTSVKNFLVYINGLPSIKINDTVESQTGARGWVTSLYPDEVEVLMLDEGTTHPGDLFRKSNQPLSIRVGDFLLGRTVNPLGMAVDGKGALSNSRKSQLLPLDRPAHGLDKRKFITEQFQTGITIIDTLIPLGKGQRELILGDARSGKTDFLIDIIINQRNTGAICVYGLIGKSITEVRSIIDILEINNALAHTVIIAASSTDIAPLIFLTPYTVMTVAEYFQSQGKDVLVILDDMGNHAKIYREIALLSNKSPGKESYPGDIFYQHAHLLERAGSFNEQVGSGSITALPIAELNLHDFTTLIPTNLMSMTDGHLLFKASLFSLGQRPPIDLGLSISRVGRQTQLKLQNDLAYRIKQILARANEVETLSRFSTELPIDIQILIRQSQQIMELIKQEQLTLIPREVQIILLCLIFTPIFMNKNVEFVQKNKQTLIDNLIENYEYQSLIKEVPNTQTVDEFLLKLQPYLGKLLQLCQP